MSAGHAQMKLIFGLVVLWEGPLDYPLLTVVVFLVLSRQLKLCVSQSKSLCSLYINIIDNLYFLIQGLDY